MSRVVAYAFGLGLVAAVAAPVFRHPGNDAYPFSTYPMFARPLTGAMLFFLEGVDHAGSVVKIPPGVAVAGDVTKVIPRVGRAVLGGRAAELCEEAAQRTASNGDHSHVEKLRIVSARFAPIRYFDVGPEPVEHTVHAECTVVRGAR